MTDADWMGGGLVVVGDQGALVRGRRVASCTRPPRPGPAAPAPPGSTRPGWGGPGGAPGGPRQGCPTAWARQPVGADQAGAQFGDQLLERSAGEALVGQDDHARPQDQLPGGLVQQPSATSRSQSFGLARHQATGTPSGLASRYSLQPQYQR